MTGPYREVLIEGAGHWLHQERPDEVNAELLQLLGTVLGLFRCWGCLDGGPCSSAKSNAAETHSMMADWGS
jgi:hypothetical protein